MRCQATSTFPLKSCSSEPGIPCQGVPGATCKGFGQEGYGHTLLRCLWTLSGESPRCLPPAAGFSDRHPRGPLAVLLALRGSFLISSLESHSQVSESPSLFNQSAS